MTEFENLSAQLEIAVKMQENAEDFIISLLKELKKSKCRCLR